MNPFTLVWLGWGAAFLAIEATAVRRRKTVPGGTLSSLVWRFIGPGHRVHRALFGVGWVVLSIHFFFGWP